MPHRPWEPFPCAPQNAARTRVSRLAADYRHTRAAAGGARNLPRAPPWAPQARRNPLREREHLGKGFQGSLPAPPTLTRLPSRAPGRRGWFTMFRWPQSTHPPTLSLGLLGGAGRDQLAPTVLDPGARTRSAGREVPPGSQRPVRTHPSTSANVLPGVPKTPDADLWPSVARRPGGKGVGAPGRRPSRRAGCRRPVLPPGAPSTHPWSSARPASLPSSYSRLPSPPSSGALALLPFPCRGGLLAGAAPGQSQRAERAPRLLRLLREPVARPPSPLRRACRVPGPGVRPAAS